MIEKNLYQPADLNFRACVRPVARVSVAAALLLICSAAAPLQIAVAAPDAAAAAWPVVATEQILFVDMPERVLGATARSAVPTTESFSALMEDIEATIHAPGFLESVQAALLLLLGLFVAVDRRRFAAWFRQVGSAAISRLVRLARTVVEFADQPATQQPRRIRTFEPLLRVAEPVPYGAWPAMSIADHDCVTPSRAYSFVEPSPRGKPAPPPPRQPQPHAEAQPLTLSRYSFYTLNQWGIVDCRTEHSFGSDAAALTHAARVAGSGCTEVWRDGQKLGTISQAAAPDYRLREYA